ncbi:MAG: arylesterase [Alphaproteobacteria bacterium]
MVFNRYVERAVNFNTIRIALYQGALIVLLFAPVDVAGAGTMARIVVLGDSLTAGYGLAAEDAFPARLEAALRAGGYKVRVINAGVSGDTSAGGLARLDWALAEAPDAAIIELGANDALRGLPPAMTRANLDAIVTRLKGRGIKVLLTGMRAPPNMGSAYGAAFDAIYPALAEAHEVALYPFFLDGIALKRALNQPDGMHPNAKGVAAIVDRIVPYVVRLLKSGG